MVNLLRTYGRAALRPGVIKNGIYHGNLSCVAPQLTTRTMATSENHLKVSSIDVHALLKDIAVCEGQTRALCGQLKDNPKLGFNCEMV